MKNQNGKMRSRALMSLVKAELVEHNADRSVMKLVKHIGWLAFNNAVEIEKIKSQLRITKK